VKALGFAALAIASLLTLFFITVLKPTTLNAALMFGGWLLLPYAVLALGVAFFVKDERSAKAWLLLILLVAGGGLLFLANILFGRPDAQGGLGIAFTPIYQALAAGVLLPACLSLVRQKK
jgi:hypothetical protein